MTIISIRIDTILLRQDPGCRIMPEHALGLLVEAFLVKPSRRPFQKNYMVAFHCIICTTAFDVTQWAFAALQNDLMIFVYCQGKT